MARTPSGRRRLVGKPITRRTGCWIKYQLDLRSLTYRTVAEKANVTESMIPHFLAGRKNSAKVRTAVAEVLGYPSFDAVVAASSGKEAV